MQLVIDGVAHEFTPIKAFRAMHHLPDNFGVAHFEPKNYSGLGSIEHKGSELNFMREMVVESLPSDMTPHQWMNFLPTLEKTFRRHLLLSGTGLREFEVDFAVAGLHNVCQAMIYAKIQASAQQKPVASFEEIYDTWLQSTVRISQNAYPYNDWRVKMVNHAYGRIGLMIQAGDETYYVLENSLACPAERFMHDLLREISTFILS